MNPQEQGKGNQLDLRRCKSAFKGTETAGLCRAEHLGRGSCTEQRGPVSLGPECKSAHA